MSPRQCAYYVALATAIVFGNGEFSTPVAGQAIPSGLPTDCSAYDSVPLPAEAQKVPVLKTAPACASYRSYRGIGRPVNYAEARACAWQERLAQQANLGQNPDEPSAWVVGGSLILADIYYNGTGVKRDIPLAIRFACEFEEGAAKLALGDITKSNASLPARGPFEFCDYAATTLTGNFCTTYRSEIEDDRRNRYYDSLKPAMTPEQRSAFEKLIAAQDAYIQAHAFEVYQGGTIRVMRTIGSKKILKDLFHAELVHFESRTWPALSHNQIATADALLSREYENKLEQLGKQTEEEIGDGAIKASDLSKVEAVWENYRDAWDVFARLRYPDAAAAIRAQITLDRYRLVKTF